jgi:hypothetical protein
VARGCGVDHGAGINEAGSFAWALAMAEAARTAVRMLRLAIRNSRDHFMVGQHSCLFGLANKGICCIAAKGLTRGCAAPRPHHAGATSTGCQLFRRHPAIVAGN